MVSRITISASCGPCSCYPVKTLRAQGIEPVGTSHTVESSHILCPFLLKPSCAFSLKVPSAAHHLGHCIHNFSLVLMGDGFER